MTKITFTPGYKDGRFSLSANIDENGIYLQLSKEEVKNIIFFWSEGIRKMKTKRKNANQNKAN